MEKRVWNLGLSGEKSGPWTEQDVALLRERYATMPTAELASLLGKTPQAVSSRACRLGLRKGARHKHGHRSWSQEDDALLRECVKTMSASGTAQLLGRTIDSVLSRACKLGVRFTAPKSRFEQAWPPELEALLRAGAEAGKSLGILAQEVGKSVPAVFKALRRLGIRRAPLKESRPPGRPKGAGAGRSSVVAPEGWMPLRDAAEAASCSREKILRLFRSGRIEGRRNERGCWIASSGSVLAYVREERMRAERAEMPAEASGRPQEGRKRTPAAKRAERPARALRRPPEAKGGDAHADAGQKLEGMSKLDILKALASGRTIGGCHA